MKTTDELGPFLKKNRSSTLNFSVLGEILAIDLKKLRRWYKDVLSGYKQEGLELAMQMMLP